MNQACRAAATRLALLLEAENALLAAADFGRIGERSDEKRSLIAELDANRGNSGEADTEADRTLARRLDTLAAENRTALEHALRIQGQILELLGNAARRLNEPTGYGARGARPAARSAQAFALVVRA